MATASTELIQCLTKKSGSLFRIAIVGLLVTAFIAYNTPQEVFYRSYLTSFIFWLGVTLGAFPLICIHNLVEGDWGYPIRRLFELMTQNLPLMVLFLIPVILGLHHLYIWTDVDLMAHDHILHKKEIYLNETAFYIRLVIYFVFWMGLGKAFNVLSLKQDKNPTRDINKVIQGLSGAGLMFFALITTFAVVDFIMSLEPHWFSTIYGVLVIETFALTSLSFVVITVLTKRNLAPFKSVLDSGRIRDFALLFFAMGMLWAYLSVSQFIIIWNGNLQEEAPWYIQRFQNGWHYVILFIIACQLLLPFLSFMFTPLKRSAKYVIFVASVIFFSRYVETWWLTQPTFYDSPTVNWLDFTIPVTMGSIWIWVLIQRMKKEPLTFDQDPILQQKH